MVETAQTFQKRTRQLSRRHSKMGANGVRMRMGRDGLVSLEPRRRAPRFPLKGFIIFFAAALTYKAVVLAWFGEQLYNDRLAELAGGTAIENAGAWVLQIDPVTQAMAEFIRPYLNAFI